MKILVISDSHRFIQNLIQILETNIDADQIIFLGDGEDDIEECEYIFPELRSGRLITVSGNCDCSMTSTRALAELSGHRLFCTHGHVQNVKRGLSLLEEAARKNQCDIALFGHTHQAFYEERDGIHLFNPGSVADGKYGIIRMEDDGRVTFSHREI